MAYKQTSIKRKQKAAAGGELFLFSAEIRFLRHALQIRVKCANRKNVNIALLLLSV